MKTEAEKLIHALQESMHTLVTPEFTGTHDEMITAAGYWVTLISQIRSLFNTISSFDNRAAIINQLEKEVSIMKAELDNLSATITTDGNGLPSMGQPAPTTTAPIEVEPEPEADPKVEAEMQRMRANAGVASNIKVHPLSRVTY